jgi:hypothetical protein
VSRPSKHVHPKRSARRCVKVGEIECKPSRSRPAVKASLLASRASLLSGLTKDAVMIRRLQLAK